MPQLPQRVGRQLGWLLLEPDRARPLRRRCVRAAATALGPAASRVDSGRTQAPRTSTSTRRPTRCLPRPGQTRTGAASAALREPVACGMETRVSGRRPDAAGRSFYHDVKCRQCKHVVGRRYISTPEALRELMCVAQALRSRLGSLSPALTRASALRRPRRAATCLASTSTRSPGASRNASQRGLPGALGGGAAP